MIVNDKLVGLIIRWCGVRLPGGPPKIEKPLFAVAFLRAWGGLLPIPSST